MKKKVSIIIPVYNVQRYLVECLDSVIGQTYHNLEIILIDDGATDESGKICDKYAELDDRIKVIHQSNQGAANAKNVGLDTMTGEYVTFIDSDDFAEPDWVEYMVCALEGTQADVVECNFILEYINKIAPGNNNLFFNKEFTNEEYMAQYLDNWTCSLFWNKLFRRELTEKIRFRKERRCIDDEFYTYKIFAKAKKIIRIDNVLYHYRQRISSVVTSEKNQHQITDDALEVLIERYTWIKKCFPKLTTTYLKHDIDILFYFRNSLLFTNDTVRKYKKIRRYYLKECFMHYPGRVTVQNMIMLMGVKRDYLLRNKEIESSIDREEYFL